MSAKAMLVLCALTLLVQTALSQCIGSSLIGAGLGSAFGLGYDGYGLGGCGCFGPASVGGSFVVTSASPIAPTGVTVVSENIYEGALTVGGNLPLLGSVGVEGEFPTAGAGAVSYGCGDSAVGIVAEEGPIETGIVTGILAPGYGLACCGAPYGYGLGLGYGRGFGLGYGPGLYGLGYGYGTGCGLGYCGLY